MSRPKIKSIIIGPAISLFAASFSLLFAVSCGYRSVGATTGEGGKRIAVPIARNQTAMKGLAGPLTSSLRIKLAKTGLEVTQSNRGAPRLEVDIILVESEPGMLTVNGSHLDAVDSIRSIHARATLVGYDGEILEGPHQFEVQGRAYAGGNPVSDEALGSRKLRALLDDLAAEIVARFVSE